MWTVNGCGSCETFSWFTITSGKGASSSANTRSYLASHVLHWTKQNWCGRRHTSFVKEVFYLKSDVQVHSAVCTSPSAHTCLHTLFYSPVFHLLFSWWGSFDEGHRACLCMWDKRENKHTRTLGLVRCSGFNKPTKVTENLSFLRCLSQPFPLKLQKLHLALLAIHHR